jgi:dTDP-4-amino-4,6-dideoxygalactose transaminase
LGSGRTNLVMTTGALIDSGVSTVPLMDLSGMNSEVDDVVEQGWKIVRDTRRFIGGPLVERFEQDWAAYCGTTHCVGVANGTDALELVLRALQIDAGAQVILPANTFTATAEAVVMAGAVPRFADVDSKTLLLTAETIRAALTDRTAAIITVHLYGHMPDMQEILDLAATTGVAVIEDAAQAHGSTWREQKAGSFGVAGCFSFYPGKNLGAYGDGGAVVTDDDTLAEKIRSISNHGRSSTSKYAHSWVGRNSRLDAVQAVVLSAKLSRLDGWNRARREAVAAYSELLIDSGVMLVEASGDAISAYHLNVARVSDRARVQRELADRGVQTDVHYPTPLHLMDFYGDKPGVLPAAEQAADEVLSLPLFPNISSEQIQTVCSHLREVVKHA